MTSMRDLAELARLKRGRLVVECPACGGALVVPVMDAEPVHCACGMRYLTRASAAVPGAVGLMPTGATC
jgi:hypothetical protein